MGATGLRLEREQPKSDNDRARARLSQVRAAAREVVPIGNGRWRVTARMGDDWGTWRETEAGKDPLLEVER